MQLLLIYVSIFSISLYYSPSLSALQHLQSFTCILFLHLPPSLPFPLSTTIFFSVSSSCACNPVMGYCFSNLADRGQYLCIVFQYPFLMLTWAPVWPRHKSTTETQSYSPLPSYYILPSLPSTDTQFFFFLRGQIRDRELGFMG